MTIKPIAPLLFLLLFTTPLLAHYGMLIPSDSVVTSRGVAKIGLELSFSHPFERIGMDLEKPKRFAVLVANRTQDLRPTLRRSTLMGKRSWRAEYRIRRPGSYHFFMVPKPYWEPAEDCFIIHYTKTVVAAFGDDEGWDREIGLETEIVPLAKPFALYAGNVFQGVVKLKGKVVPFAKVEVEYYNRDGTSKAPNSLMITQTIKADSNGVFTYAVPSAGWWGFAALSQADYKITYKGKGRDVELGAVLWVEFKKWRLDN